MTQTPWRSKIVGHGRVAVGDLRPHPANWRTHPRAQREALSGAIAEVGYIRSVLVNRQTGNLLDGHLRVDLARAAGEPEVDAEYVDLTPEEERAALLSLDPIGAMAGADTERLEALLREVRTDDAGLRGMLRDLADEHGIAPDPDSPPAAPEPEVDRAEELRAKWGTAPGQLWEIGRHRLLCGDATHEADVDRLTGGTAPAAVFTDPPYGIHYDPTWLDGVGRRKGALSSRDTLANDDGSLDLAFLWRYPRRLVWGFPYLADPEATGWVVWDKQPGVDQRGIVTPVEMASTTMRRGFDMVRVMWGGYYRAAGEERLPHPTQKPVGVYAPFIKDWTGTEDVVLDPFAGTGTTLVAAERLGRRGYGMEIEPGYVAVTLERLFRMGLEPRLVES